MQGGVLISVFQGAMCIATAWRGVFKPDTIVKPADLVDLESARPVIFIQFDAQDLQRKGWNDKAVVALIPHRARIDIRDKAIRATRTINKKEGISTRLVHDLAVGPKVPGTKCSTIVLMNIVGWIPLDYRHIEPFLRPQDVEVNLILINLYPRAPPLSLTLATSFLRQFLPANFQKLTRPLFESQRALQSSMPTRIIDVLKKIRAVYPEGNEDNVELVDCALRNANDALEAATRHNERSMSISLKEVPDLLRKLLEGGSYSYIDRLLLDHRNNPLKFVTIVRNSNRVCGVAWKGKGEEQPSDKTLGQLIALLWTKDHLPYECFVVLETGNAFVHTGGEWGPCTGSETLRACEAFLKVVPYLIHSKDDGLRAQFRRRK